MQRRRLHVLVVIVGLWLLAALPAWAQTGTVLIEDPDGLLGDTGQIRAAAEELAAEGADVIVVAAAQSAGASGPEAERFLGEYLNREGIALSYNNLNPNQIVFYAATQARVTGLFYGIQWRDRLTAEERRIREQVMTPPFGNRDFAGGFVAGINAVRDVINPPTPTSVYVLGGALATVAAGAVALPLLRKRRQTSDLLVAARERLAHARNAAGSAIADLGQLVDQAQEKAKFDQLSYSRTDLERVQTLHSQGMSVFGEAQAAFDAAEEQTSLKPPQAPRDYDAITAQYEKARQLAEQAARPVREVEALRATLDAQPAPSTGPTRRLGE